MAREYLIVWAGRHRRDVWESLCSDYRERMERWVPVREVAVKVKPTGDERARLAAEGEALLAALPDPCWLVALDRRGRELSTLDLADRLGGSRPSGPIRSRSSSAPTSVSTARSSTRPACACPSPSSPCPTSSPACCSTSSSTGFFPSTRESSTIGNQFDGLPLFWDLLLT